MIRTALAIAALAVATMVIGLPKAEAKTLNAIVDLSDQQLIVVYKGEELVRWSVSTGRAGFRTPSGTYRPQRMYVDYYSRQYDGAPMPHAIFYDRGYAIHGSYETRSLGRPASHGCVRLHPGNAQKLFDLVLTVGPENTAITVRR